jgi:hypothetical protein
MTDTAQEVTPIPEPELDLDAMLADLHENFPDPAAAESGPSSTTTDEGAGEEADPLVQAGQQAEGDGSSAAPSPPTVETALPPGMVEFGGEVMPLQEAQALLELNRQVKGDPEKARRVRDAVLGSQQQAPQEPQLPEWLDPDDQQAIFLYRQQQRIDAELAEIKAAENRRKQSFELSQAEQRKQLVISSFRSALGSFHVAHPEFEGDEVKMIVDKAATMGLLEQPEKLDPEGSLEGGMSQALDLAMWAVPEYREKVLHSDTVRTKAQQSADRKHKSSALSSSTGSTPRNTTQEAKPGNRQEMMANMLSDFRSGLAE